MSDSTRIIRPPSSRSLGTRTLGDLQKSTETGGVDASTGQPVSLQAQHDEMQALLKQNQELSGNTPQPPPRRAPNVNEHVVQLPADRVSDDIPYEDEPPNKQPKRTPTEELSNKAALGGSLTPPPIKPAQYEARRKRAKDEDKDADESTQVYTGKPRFVTKQINRAAHFERVPLLSGFVFYPWKDLQVRKINIPDQVQISRAQKTQNITAFIDAVGATLDPAIDIRDFAVPDFFYLLYWHRFNSYTSTPFLVSWTSKYGNRNDYRITDTNLKYDTPTISEEEYLEWTAKGFCIPTVREMEVFMTENLDEEETDLLLRAQFFRGIGREDGGPTEIQDKIDAMMELGADSVDILEQLNEFRRAINFGVVERADVTDAKFDPDKWADSLEKQESYLRLEAESIRELNSGVYIARMAEADEAAREAKEIRDSLTEGGEVLPDIESITLNVGVLDFFPNL